VVTRDPFQEPAAEGDPGFVAVFDYSLDH
jgi:hypothetical protein